MRNLSKALAGLALLGVFFVSNVSISLAGTGGPTGGGGGGGSVHTGTGLTGNGSSGSPVALQVPVTVAHGGTNGTSASPTTAHNIGASANGQDYVVNLGASPGDINCPAGTDTLIDSATITVPYSGTYEVIFSGWVPTQTGATPPSQIDYKMQMTSNGADTFVGGDTQPAPYLLFANNTWNQEEVNTFTTAGYVGWVDFVDLIAGEIYTPKLLVNPTGQPVTVLLGGFHRWIFQRSDGWSSVVNQTGGVLYNQ